MKEDGSTEEKLHTLSAGWQYHISNHATDVMWGGRDNISFCITHIYIHSHTLIRMSHSHTICMHTCSSSYLSKYYRKLCIILSPLGLPDSAALDHAAALHRCMMQWHLSCQLASTRLLFVWIPLYCPLITCRIPQQVLMTTQDYMHCLFLSKQVSCIKGTVCVYVHSESHVHSWLSIRTSLKGLKKRLSLECLLLVCGHNVSNSDSEKDLEIGAEKLNDPLPCG